MRSSKECPKCGGRDIAGPHYVIPSYGAASSVILDLPQKSATLIA
jgi:hypothetical protein